MKKESHLPILKLIPFLSLFLIIGCSTTETPIEENVFDDDEETVTENPNDPDDSGNDNNSDGNPVLTDFYRFTTYQTSTADPFDVNILFHVSDNAFIGVPNLKIEDLIITENDEESPIDESKAALFDRNSFELVMRTALLIDVSNSIQTDFATLKEELKALIDGALPFQEIAIYTFSSTTQLVQDYSTDKEQLKGSIDNLQLGTSSTDFYGAVVTAANSFTNGFVENEVTIGNLVIFTDGDDTQASNTFTAAKEALLNKNAYVVGLSSEDLDEDNIKNLFGENFYFSSETIGTVNESFGLIQTEIENYANSVYLLNYETPKRGDNNHYLKIYHKENSNDGADHYAVGEFVSTGFYEPVAPTAVTLISPIINEEITLTNTCSVTFEVGKSIDENLTANDEITYEFYFGDSETTLELIDTRTVPVTQETIFFESPSGLIPNSNYLWQIRTKDDDFDQLDVYSEINMFLYKESIYTGGSLLVDSSDIQNSCYTKIHAQLEIADGELFTEQFIGFPNLTEVNSIRLNNVATTDFFPKLKSINNSLIIGNLGFSFNNNTLKDIDGFESLESAKSIFIVGNKDLSTITGFSKLLDVETIVITENQNLELIESFNDVMKLPGGSSSVALRIAENPKLEIINSFKNVVEIGFVEIKENNGLNSINSFETLEIANNDFLVLNNPNLKSIHLQNLHLVKGRLNITFNTLLTEINIPKLQAIEDILTLRNNIELSLLNINNGNDFQVLVASISDNSKLFDFCRIAGIKPIRNNGYLVNGNGFNPTIEELANGNCKL
jgi:hypothetical protein